jgi:hypothetical protein
MSQPDMAGGKGEPFDVPLNDGHCPSLLIAKLWVSMQVFIIYTRSNSSSSGLYSSMIRFDCPGFISPGASRTWE